MARTVGRRKITHGYVEQIFDDNGKCIEQEFTAGDVTPVEWEGKDDEIIKCPDDCEYRFDMVQPEFKFKIVCSTCGSDDVRRDATAEWNVDEQEWELAAVMDQGYCEGKCAGECKLIEIGAD